MLSTIALKESMSRLFGDCEYICEVYANPDFSFEQIAPIFTILYKDGLDIVWLYNSLLKFFPEMVFFYVTRNPIDGVLQNTKMIWRKGVWYV